LFYFGLVLVVGWGGGEVLEARVMSNVHLIPFIAINVCQKLRDSTFMTAFSFDFLIIF
jgi:hypothetical protein